MIRTDTDVSVVAAQLTAFSVVILTGDMAAVLAEPHVHVMAIVGGGLLLMIFIQVQLGRSYSSLSRPRASNVFVRKGIYRYLRHPIYTGLLIATFAFFLSRPNPVTGTAYLLVALVTNIRAGIEQHMLEERHPEYAEYRSRTKRYIPFVY